MDTSRHGSERRLDGSTEVQFCLESSKDTALEFVGSVIVVWRTLDTGGHWRNAVLIVICAFPHCDEVRHTANVS